MESELLAVLNYLETERGIDKERLFELIEDSLLVAARKSAGPVEELQVKIDRNTGKIRAWATLKVVDDVEDETLELDLGTARQQFPMCEIGDTIDWEVTPEDFGRIAAQTAKQALASRLRREEKTIACEEYKDRVGTIVTGKVKTFSRGEIIVDFGKVDGVIPRNEKVPSENWTAGEHISVLLKELDPDRPGPSLVLSRRDPEFVKQLFEREVVEIREGLIEIKGVARDAGFRSKIAVYTEEPGIDPIGSCVGMRGARVKSIVRELNGEKVDIVIWSADLETFVRNAMKPAELKSVAFDEKAHTIKLKAREDQYSLAIGKKGQNARLASKLVDWLIDIEKEEILSLESGFEEQLNKAVADLSAIDGVDETVAKALVNAGFLTVMGLKAADVNDLTGIEGIDEELAGQIVEAVSKL